MEFVPQGHPPVPSINERLRVWFDRRRTRVSALAATWTMAIFSACVMSWWYAPAVAVGFPTATATAATLVGAVFVKYCGQIFARAAQVKVRATSVVSAARESSANAVAAVKSSVTRVIADAAKTEIKSQLWTVVSATTGVTILGLGAWAFYQRRRRFAREQALKLESLSLATVERSVLAIAKSVNDVNRSEMMAFFHAFLAWVCTLFALFSGLGRASGLNSKIKNIFSMITMAATFSTAMGCEAANFLADAGINNLSKDDEEAVKDNIELVDDSALVQDDVEKTDDDSTITLIRNFVVNNKGKFAFGTFLILVLVSAFAHHKIDKRRRSRARLEASAVEFFMYFDTVKVKWRVVAVEKRDSGAFIVEQEVDWDNPATWPKAVTLLSTQASLCSSPTLIPAAFKPCISKVLGPNAIWYSSVEASILGVVEARKQGKVIARNLHVVRSSDNRFIVYDERGNEVTDWQDAKLHFEGYDDSREFATKNAVDKDQLICAASDFYKWQEQARKAQRENSELSKAKQRMRSIEYDASKYADGLHRNEKFTAREYLNARSKFMSDEDQEKDAYLREHSATYRRRMEQLEKDADDDKQLYTDDNGRLDRLESLTAIWDWLGFKPKPPVVSEDKSAAAVAVKTASVEAAVKLPVCDIASCVDLFGKVHKGYFHPHKLIRERKGLLGISNLCTVPRCDRKCGKDHQPAKTQSVPKKERLEVMSEDGLSRPALLNRRVGRVTVVMADGSANTCFALGLGTGFSATVKHLFVPQALHGQPAVIAGSHEIDRSLVKSVTVEQFADGKIVRHAVDVAKALFHPNEDVAFIPAPLEAFKAVAVNRMAAGDALVIYRPGAQLDADVSTTPGRLVSNVGDKTTYTNDTDRGWCGLPVFKGDKVVAMHRIGHVEKLNGGYTYAALGPMLEHLKSVGSSRC